MVADAFGHPLITSTTRVDVIKFDLNRTRAVMKSHGPATNVFSVVSSDGQLADWEIASTGPIGYPTYIFDSLQAAENPFYSTSLAGAGEVYVMPGAPLRTMVVATHPLYTNITQTAELVVVDIKLEPITTATDVFNRTINPSGVPADGGFGTFRIAVEPAEWVPDADIEWVPYDPTSVRFWNDNSNGREVEMGLYNGASQTVSVVINDLVHPAPEISFVGHNRRTIPVRFMVTCDRYGNYPAASATQCTNWVRDANAIFDQIGITLVLQSVAFTNRLEWWELDYTNNVVKAALRSSLTTDEGFEIYVIDHLVNSFDQISAFNSPEGTIIQGTTSPSTLAHELGHQLGFLDIYNNGGQYATNSVPDNLVSQAWMPHDWTGDQSVSYYRHELRHWETLRRLLMYGRESPGVASGIDIPLGDIYGVWYKVLNQSNILTRVYYTDFAPVGQNHVKDSDFSHQ